jgi:hypothetical protein
MNRATTVELKRSGEKLNKRNIEMRIQFCLNNIKKRIICIYVNGRITLSSQKHWLHNFFSSGILNARKHNVSKTGSASIFRLGEGNTYCVGRHRKSLHQSLDLPSNGPNRVDISLPSREDKNGPIFRNVVLYSYV